MLHKVNRGRVPTVSAVLARLGMGKLGRLGLEPAVRYARELGARPLRSISAAGCRGCRGKPVRGFVEAARGGSFWEDRGPAMISGQAMTSLRKKDRVSDPAQLPGELLYEYASKFTQVVEYGVSMEALLSGETPPPPEGARFDVYFEGPITGAKLSGSVKGVDYLHLRADGRFQLRIHAEITTEDGKKIALFADGVGLGGPPVLQLRENVTLTTSHPEYTWVNTLQIWAPGTVDVTSGEIRIKGYAV